MFKADRIRSKWHPSGEHAVRPNSQPYFKLHGSSSWLTEGAEPMLVVGTNKPGLIRQHLSSSGTTRSSAGICRCLIRGSLLSATASAIST